MRGRTLLGIIGPGLLVAATGVGAGDLATASLAGAHIGTAVLWAVVLGAVMKYVVTEGLARWQLATGDTLLEGSLRRFGRPFQFFFLVYLLGWSFFVGSALMAACGVVAAPLLPAVLAGQSKIVLGIAHSILAVVLILAGGFRLFERLMAACIALMFATVVFSAFRVGVDLGAIFSGVFLPHPETLAAGNLTWTLAVVGGVGGTLTVLCYGYWIREHQRQGAQALPITRIDLAVAYTMTGLFGIAMVIIGSGLELAPDTKGAAFVVALAGALETASGPLGRAVFLVGAWGAMFSSLFGVWQSVPYIFADFWYVSRNAPVPAVDLTQTRPYRAYLVLLATVPATALLVDFVTLQKLYAVVGACFLPVLALLLLLLNGPLAPQGHALRNRWYTAVGLVGVLAFFGITGGLKVLRTLDAWGS